MSSDLLRAVETDSRAETRAVLPCSTDLEWEEAGGIGVRVFDEGDSLFASMLADIDVARERVWLESYIFEDDSVGGEIVERLLHCAARGVDVRVRVDAFGSKFGFSGGSARRLGEGGVRFSWCHPWQWLRPWTFHRRNHRKLLVVDSDAAYLGGFNISEVNSRRVEGERRWRDTHLRLTGPIVAAAADAYVAFGKGNLRWRDDGQQALRLLTNHARGCRYRLRCVLRQHLAEARHRIWVTTPYFVPDSSIQHDLAGAAQRGVDVRVLSPAKSDMTVVQWASRAAYSRLLRAGVRLFEYQPRTLHAKTLLVDDDWSTIGTANVDYRSFFINYELNLVARSTRLNRALAISFERDLLVSREIRRRPWSSRPLVDRVAELVGWSARHWL